jgi:hypothetical protein
VDLTMRTQESELAPAGLQQEVVDLRTSCGGCGRHVGAAASGYYTL